MPEALTEDEIYLEFLEAVSRAGSQKAFAREVGVSDAFISTCMMRRKPVQGKVLAALGYERHVEVRYVPTSSRLHAPSRASEDV